MTLTPSRATDAQTLHLTNGDFPATAPAANPVFYRTYSRKTTTGRESWDQVGQRNLEGLRQLGPVSYTHLTLPTTVIV